MKIKEPLSTADISKENRFKATIIAIVILSIANSTIVIKINDMPLVTNAITTVISTVKALADR